MIHYALHSSPLGELVLTMNSGQLTGLWMEGEKHCPPIDSDWQKNASPFSQVRKQLDEYFSGKRKIFSLDSFTEGTAFQHAVWQQLTKITYGTTASYASIAAAIGNHRATRAVGTANGKNHICIIIPCHRVIAGNGAIAGYSGGITNKKWLLNHEAAHR